MIDESKASPTGPSAPLARSGPPDVFRKAFESVPEAVIEVDAEGIIVFANAGAEAMFGYKPSELTGNPVEMLIPRELRTVHEDKRADFAEQPHSRGMGSSVPFAGQRKNGTRFSADVALSPFRVEGSGEFHTFAFVRDVTHLRRLEIAERELLDKTLLGVVATLNELMSLTSPLIFERTQSIRALVSHMLKGFDPKELWQYQLAAALSLIGCSTLPPMVFERTWSGMRVSEEEDRAFRSHPTIAEKLLAPINRLGGVAKIVGGQLRQASPQGGAEELGICLLQLAQHADRLLYRATPFPDVHLQLRARRPAYDEDLLDALVDYVPVRTEFEAKALRVGQLREGMILDQDLTTISGLVIAPKDTMINLILLERVRNFSVTAGVPEPVKVRCPV
jgi:PAS domain S-box-containing protein